MALFSRLLRNALVTDNGNILGLIELLSHWDSIRNEHVLKVEELQKNCERLPVYCLSN